MEIQIISKNDYEILTKNSQVLKWRNQLPSLLITEDNYVLKHIYKRNLFSSSTFWPYAKRFCKNAARLQKLDIKAPIVEKLLHYPELNCDLILYPKLQGEDGQMLFDCENFSDIYLLPYFVAQLHKKGVYFRDLHLKNLIRHEKSFALVDIQSIQIKRRSLSVAKRIKNIERLFRKELHLDYWTESRKLFFLQTYLVAAKLNTRAARAMQRLLRPSD